MSGTEEKNRAAVGRPMHSFAVCAYGDSPYLEDCLRSLREQTAPSELLVCTATPSPYIAAAAERYGARLCVRDGKPGIGADWNFAFDCAGGRFVTLAHQDDIYGKHYTETLLDSAARWKDMVLFTARAVTLKDGRAQRPGMVEYVKLLLRIPLQFRRFSHRTAWKRLVLRFGNPVVCPACAYRKDVCGSAPFSTRHSFILDWKFLFALAEKGGRWICAEKPLILYRVHADAATAACIEDRVREREETEMFERLWGRIPARLILHFYRRSYEAYTE